MTEVLGCCVVCTHGQVAVRLHVGKGKFVHLIYLARENVEGLTHNSRACCEECSH